MAKCHKTYKVELNPTGEQIKIIERTMGVCRYVYNFFVEINRDNYRKGSQSYMSGYDFSKWLNNEYRKSNPDKSWIWEVSSKAVKKAIMNADKAYRNFMNGKTGFPNFKKRSGKPTGVYLPRNNPNDLRVERHRSKIPTLGWIRFKEYGYIPQEGQALSVTITRRAGRYFASFVFEREKVFCQALPKSEGVGIDLGVKSFAVLSDGRSYPNINKTSRMRKLKKRLKREQRKFSRKLSHRREEAAKKCKGSNLDKQRLKLQKAHKKITDKRRDYVNKTVNDIISVRPKYITIEDLNVSGMMKNRHLSRAISECRFWYFRETLERKCRQYGIELRIVDRFYASSKTCSQCGHVKKDLKLSDRVYVCENCGTTLDRDFNAAVNLRKCVKYRTAG